MRTTSTRCPMKKKPSVANFSTPAGTWYNWISEVLKKLDCSSVTDPGCLSPDPNFPIPYPGSKISRTPESATKYIWPTKVFLSSQRSGKKSGRWIVIEIRLISSPVLIVLNPLEIVGTWQVTFSSYILTLFTTRCSSRIQIFSIPYPGSGSKGQKNHRIPDPQHWTVGWEETPLHTAVVWSM